MAHEILNHNGIAQAIYGRGRPAWHNLGQVMPEYLSWDDALAVVDYEVECRGAFYAAKGGMQSAPGQVVVGRWQNGIERPLALVGDGYEPVQNRDAFAVCRLLGRIDTAGTLADGRRAWMLVHLESESFSIGKPEDQIETYVLVSNAHDGKQAVRMALTTIRVVCANTEGAAISQAKNSKKSYFAIPHTGNALPEVERVSKILIAAKAGVSATRDAFELIASRKLDGARRAEIIERLFGWAEADRDKEISERVKENRAETLKLIQSFLDLDPLADPSTGWGTFNALTAWSDHGRTCRDDATRFESAHFGAGARFKARALKEIVAAVS